LSAFSLVQKRGADLLLAAFELPKYTGTPGKALSPETSVLELVTFVEPLEYTFGDDLTNAVSRALFIEAAPLFAARNGNRVVAAAPEAVLFVDYDLNAVKAAYDLGGKPLALSVDEDSHAYLIVEVSTGRRLTKISPQGSLLFSADLPPGKEPNPTPPVVGYDHRVFAIVENQLLAFAPDGALQWRRSVSKPGGMVVTPTGTLLVSDGSELALFNKDGERKQLFDFPKEQLTTPPTITEKGDILVASKAYLYQLRAK
jgi:sugar lactone lactonase YvrE